MKLPDDGLDERTRGYLMDVDHAQRRAIEASIIAYSHYGTDLDSGPQHVALASLVRAGCEIARYAMAASLRPRANDANVQFAAALVPLWGQVDDDPASTLSRALITVQAFARTAETQVLPDPRGRGELLTHVSGVLREASHETEWYPHVLEGDHWGDVLGYQATIAARRSTLVWRALEQLASALAEGLALPSAAPPVPDTPFLPFPSTARRARNELQLDFLWAAEAAPPAPESPQAPAPPPEDRAVEVWWGTSRALRPGTRAEFGPRRSDTLHLGRSYVHVPAAHRPGSVGSRWWQKLLRFDFRDDTLKLQSTDVLDGDFDAALRARLAENDDAPRALLYVHGYNTSFEDAAIRTAQLAVDLHVDGIAAFYSWPSWASAVEYVADLAQAESSWEKFVEFVEALKHAGIQRLDVVVHSMGNRVLAWAIERLARGGTPFASLFLAAADLDPDILKQRLRFYRQASQDITLYVSRYDKALGLSRHLQLVGRVGLTPEPTIVDGAWTIDASHVDDSFLGHGYYSDEPRVLIDLAGALQGLAPAERTWLRAEERPAPHWSLTR